MDETQNFNVPCEMGLSKTFSYGSSNVRMKKVNGTVFVCLTDMAKGFPSKNLTSIVNSKEMTDYLKVLSKLQNCSLEYLLKTNRGNVTDQGTWAHRKIALRVAQKLSPDFAIWVDDRIEELLTYGMTATQSTLDEMIDNPDLVIKLATQLKHERAERARLEAENAEKCKAIEQAEEQVIQLSDTVASMKPKVDYCDIILQSKETVATTQIAQDYGMTAKAFNILLRNFGIQHKVAGQWILYAPYLPLGYVQSESIPITHTDGRKTTKLFSKWTQKGRLFLYEELKKNNVLPLIERKEKVA